jgi:hypothetical protein
MSPYGHPNHKPTDDGRSRRELTPAERIGWSNWQRERKRIQERNANLQATLIAVLLVIIFTSLVAINASKAHAQTHATTWSTLPETALRVCFIDDGAWDCLYRVSDFDTLRFCPGTGDALHQPSAPGMVMVGFTDPVDGTFMVVRQQAYQWRQLQPYEGRIVIGVDPDVLGSFADGFEDCDEYRT